MRPLLYIGHISSCIIFSRSLLNTVKIFVGHNFEIVRGVNFCVPLIFVTPEVTQNIKKQHKLLKTIQITENNTSGFSSLLSLQCTKQTADKLLSCKFIGK